LPPSITALTRWRVSCCLRAVKNWFCVVKTSGAVWCMCTFRDSGFASKNA